MTTNLIFNDSIKYKPGIIFRLLSECYKKILDQQLKEQFQKFDREVFENPKTIGAYTFITTLGSEIVGMASYDPRQAPEKGIIGHNCILPNYQKQGYGRQQILEIVRRLKNMRISCVTVTTSDNPFFEPARKMYLSCGFSEVKRKRKQPQDAFKTIYFELDLIE